MHLLYRNEILLILVHRGRGLKVANARLTGYLLGSVGKWSYYTNSNIL